MDEKCIYEKLNSKICPIEKKFDELKALEKYELFTEWIRRTWMKWTFNTIFFTLIILFFIGIYIENKSGKSFDILKNLNTWVGFILGIIATIFSIISMFLSFYSLEKSKESEDSTKTTLKNIEETVSDVKSLIQEEFKVVKSTNKEILSKVDNPDKYKKVQGQDDTDFVRY